MREYQKRLRRQWIAGMKTPMKTYEVLISKTVCVQARNKKEAILKAEKAEAPVAEFVLESVEEI